jgi:acetate kinase
LRVLALNVGSSSLKAVLRSAPGVRGLALLAERLGSDDASLKVSGEDATVALEGGIDDAVEGVARLLAARDLSLDAVAHRVVHGGPDHYRPCVVDEALLRDLQNLVTLAPLHLPPALEAISLARRIWPQPVHVACFDTGYHHDLPETSIRLPLPVEVTDLGVRRYGFHGLSVESVLLARPDMADAVVAHLGSGCSVTAVGSDRLPRHTSMSLTPASGMMSSTRAGDLDPEILLFLIEHHGFTTSGLRDVLDRRSGLFGVSDGRRDMRDLFDADDHDAKLALAMFVSSAAMAIAACATTLDRWRWLVFTGGIGEHAAAVRAQICGRLRLDGVEVLVVPADEERVMDEMTRTLLSSEHGPLLSNRNGFSRST